ncbi:MAG: ferritin family protein [Raoultibacter sp.]
MAEVSRRNFVKGAAVGAATLGTGALLAACSAPAPKATETPKADTAKPEYTAEVLSPTAAAEAGKGSNFDIVPESKTVVGTTYENLMSAITGETGATTKYEAFAKAAEKDGFQQLNRLFTATAAAEKIHIGLEYDLAKKMKPETEKPTPPAVEAHESDINLILAAQGEIYETSDMYPSFIKKAKDEGENEAVAVFTRAKLAEAYHAERYLDAYSTIDHPSDAKYYLCPICGYIHKGENFTNCPICLAPKDSFTAF